MKSNSQLTWLTQEREFTVEEVTTIVYTAIGAGLGIAMQDNPHYVMPSEKANRAAENILMEYNVRAD